MEAEPVGKDVEEERDDLLGQAERVDGREHVGLGRVVQVGPDDDRQRSCRHPVGGLTHGCVAQDVYQPQQQTLVGLGQLFKRSYRRVLFVSSLRFSIR